MAKDKDKEEKDDKKKHKLKKTRFWGTSPSTNSAPPRHLSDVAGEFLRAKWPKISSQHLSNPYFRNLLQMSEDTIVLDRDVRYKMLGAQNLNGITCFLNATLFAIAFEGPVSRFATMVRLWVNMLRAGWFISSDIVAQLRENLAQCGWEQARMDEQQDASECYIHIVEYLKLPKSTLETHFAHGGQSDLESDFKFETEYLLDCSIPNKPPNQPVFLEECLSDYFTNIVQLRRQLGTPGDLTPNHRSGTPAVNYKTKPNLIPERSGSQPPSSSAPPPYSGNGNGFYGADEKAALKRAQQNQESNVAAWQFFKLLPYYAPTSAGSGSEMAVQLANERPMLGICLKRYGYDPIRQEPYRNGRLVVIPRYIELSNFVTQEEGKMSDGERKRYRLEFYSTVCHRGQYVHSGHYVSIIWDRQLSQWLHFDDIAGEKITSSTPEYLLANETPYLIFYQLEEIGTVPRNPGIHVPPSIPIPEIPPPPTRPPPPIPKTSFVSKEQNQSPPSPLHSPSEPPPSYQYSERSESIRNSIDSSNMSSYSEIQPNREPPPPPPLTAPPPPPTPPVAESEGYFPPPVQPPPPPPPSQYFIDMPDARNFYSVSSDLPPMHIDMPRQPRQVWSPTLPPMPAHPPPPVPPTISPVHAYGANGSSYFYVTSSGGANPDVTVPGDVRSFNMDDDEDLYGMKYDPNGKLPAEEDEKGQNKHDNCVVQ